MTDITGEVAVTETPAVETPETEAVTENTVPPDDKTAESSDEPKSEPPEKTFTQKELDDIVQRRLAKESRKIERLSRAEAERDYLRQQLTPPQAPIPSGEPKIENFKDYESYIEALTDYKVDGKLKAMQEQSSNAARQNAQQQSESRIRDNLNKVSDKYDDFEDVVTNPKLPITPAMRDALGESDNGGELAYYLGTHISEAAEIAQMTPIQQVKAIDRLEAKLKESPKVSNAPKPLDPIGGKGKTVTVNLANASMDDYMALRKKQGARYFR